MDRLRAARALIGITVLVAACGGPTPSSPAASASLSASNANTATPGASPSVDPSEAAPSVVWVPLAAAGDTPAARSGHTWVADPSDAAAYLFGGNGASGPLDDLWRYEFGSDAWERRALDAPGPEPRSGHAAVIVDDVGLVVVGGTSGDGAVLDDAWAYDPLADTWSELAVTGDLPPAQTNACATVGPDGRIWTTQGFGKGGTALPDVWALDPAGWRWSRIVPDGVAPASRGAHGCWWSVDGRLVVHGGRSEATVFGDTWALDDVVAGSDGGAWAIVDTGGPEIRRSDFGSTLASDRIVIVAGAGGDRIARDDVIALAPDRRESGGLVQESFVAEGAAPDPRTGTTIVDDPGNERSLLFGGTVEGLPTNELWSFDLR